MTDTAAKTDKPLLELSTEDREYKHIVIDNVSYRVVHVDDLSLKEYTHLRSLGTKLSNQDSLTTNPEAYEETITDTIRFILPELTKEKLSKLSMRQKNDIITVFTQEAFPGIETSQTTA